MKTKTTNEDMNYRSLSIEKNQLRAVKNNDGTTTVTGTAIVFNQPSEPIPFIEYISPHALDHVDFSKTLLLYAHDYNKILARADSGTLTTSIDQDGLHFTAKLPDTTLANDVRKDINAGNLKGCSFGFTIADGGDRYDTDSKGQTIHYVDQIDSVSELTITPIPAYNQTSVQVKRDLNSYLKSQKKEEDEMENDKKNDQQQATDEKALDEKIKKAVREAIQSMDKQKRDDEDVADDDTGVDEEDDASSSAVASSTVDSSTDSSVTSSVASSSTSSAVDSSAVSSTVSSRNCKSNSSQNQEKENQRDMLNITPNQNNNDQELRDFAHYLVTREMRPGLKREAAVQGVGLTQGSVLIPQSILAPLHESHQFNRLEDFTHNVAVTTTTGKQPYFEENTGVLQTKAEFDHAKDIQLSTLKFINWDLKTYAGKLALSREVLMDSEKGSSENWLVEAQQQMKDLQNNTNDSLIAQQLMNGATTHNATDAIQDMKTILNVNLKPKDSEASQIILTASAYNALDQLKDGFGRPLIQPDPSKATANMLFGKPVVKVADTLLGKAGDAIAVIAPLSKVIYNFQMGQVSGQFIDNFDIFDTTLGVFIRKDVVNGRPDLVNVLKLTDKSLAASAGTAGGLGK